MGRILAGVMLTTCMTIAQTTFSQTTLPPKTDGSPVAAAQSKSTIPSTLPPAPRGKSTVIGGAIRDVDPVRDQLTLKVFGGRPIKVLFDARTQFYRDGKKTPLRDLGTEAHASIQTVLDGTKIYALSIHALSQSPEGECQGQVLSYDPGPGELVVAAALSREPIKLHVPQGTPVVRVGQAAAAGGSGPSGLSSLVKGTLVSVKFASTSDGRGVANQIAILAMPGTTAVFSGTISYLDLHDNMLVVVDPRDGKSYKISFDPARFPNSRDLHPGSHVRVTANFDGTRYVADSIDVEPAAHPRPTGA